MDDTVRNLLRFVSRGFYGMPYVLILDALLLHSVLSEDDMAHLLGIQRKELRSLCNKLAEDRLVTMYVQREGGGFPGVRPSSQTYYFIHYTEAIDSIKWKVHSVVTKMKNELSGEANPQGYMCPVCKQKYSQLDAMSLLNYEMNEFMCSLCNVALIEDDSGKIAKENQDRYSNLMKQIEPIIDCLRRIDEHTVPENNFETSLEKMIPAYAKTTAQYAVSNLTKNTKMFDRNSYLNNRSSINAGARSHATLHVNISTGDEEIQREKLAAEQSDKRKQNALPSWHEESTIGKSLGRLDGDDAEETPEAGEEIKKEGDVEVKEEVKAEPVSEDQKEETPLTPAPAAPVEEGDKEEQEALAAYYAQLDKRAKEEADDEDDEEEEFDFEDVELEDVEITPPAETQLTSVVVEEIEFDSDEE